MEERRPPSLADTNVHGDTFGGRWRSSSTPRFRGAPNTAVKLEAVQLRRLTKHDAALLEPFAVMAAFPPGRELSPGALQSPHVRRWLHDWGDDELGVGFERDGALVGAAWARRVEPVLARDDAGAPLPEAIVAVTEPTRGAGVGRRMLVGLLDLARERRVRGLAVTVSDRNPVASHLYERLGFEPVGHTPSGLVAMVRRLV